MTTKKGGGSRPPPNRPAQAAPPPAPARRPQLRPIGGIKPPVLRPLNVRAPTAPRAPASSHAGPPQTARLGPAPLKKEQLPPPLEPYEPDEDETSVMDRQAFELDASPPKDRPLGAAMRPAAGRPPRPDVDLVPQTQRRGPSERTVVMPQAPDRPHFPNPQPHHKPAPSNAANVRTKSVASRPAPLPSSPPPARPPAESVPSLEALVPPTRTNAQKRSASERPSMGSRPPATQRTRPPSVFPPPQGQFIPPAPQTAPLLPSSNDEVNRIRGVLETSPDATLAMQNQGANRHLTPSAPPPPYGPFPHHHHHHHHPHPSYPPPGTHAAVPSHSQPPPAQFGHGRPLSIPPAGHLRTGSARPGAISQIPIPSHHQGAGAVPTGAHGVVGLVLFAAPLAFATAVIAALALL